MKDYQKKANNKYTKITIILILIIALITRLIHLSNNYDFWWDSYIYLAMSKAIFTGGPFGLGIWESFRPLLFPAILSIPFHLNLNQIIVGTTINLIFSLASVYLVYKITNKIFDQKTAFLASFIFALDPLFVIHTGLLLTEPLAIFLSLLGIHLLIKKDNNSQFKRSTLFLSGFILSLAAMTKFPLGLLILPTSLYLIQSNLNDIKTFLKNLVSLGAGFSIPLITFLTINQKLYQNPLLPFTSGSWIINTSTWLYDTAFSFYLQAFLYKASIYILFLIWTVYITHKLIKSSKNNPIKNIFNQNDKLAEKILVTIIPLLLLFYFIFFVARKEIRYMTLLLPWLSIGTAVMFFKIWNIPKRFKDLKNNHNKLTPKIIKYKKAAAVLVTLLLTLWIAASINHFDNKLKEDLYQEDQVIKNAKNILNQEAKYQDTIVSSHPFVSEFPVYIKPTTANPKFAQAVIDLRLPEADFIVYRTCDFLCKFEDLECSNALDEFEAQVTTIATLIHEEKYEGKLCTLKIFKTNTN